MAKKKEFSVEYAAEIFEEVISRTSFTLYGFMNRTLVYKTSSNRTILAVVEKDIWPLVVEHLKPRELDPLNAEDKELMNYISVGDDLDNEAWIELDPQKIYDGKVINITVPNHEYQISIHKSLIPLKLRKVEFNNFKYRVFYSNNSYVLAIKKQFIQPIEHTGFTIIRLFDII